MFTLLSHIYTISNIINNTNPISAKKTNQVCCEKRIPELIIETLNYLNEKNIFINFDKAYSKADAIILINTKTLLFRTMFHCITLINFFKQNYPKSVSPIYIEKIYKVIKTLDDNDSIFNPDVIERKLENVISFEF